MSRAAKNVFLLLVAVCAGAVITFFGSSLLKGKIDSALALLGKEPGSDAIASACIPGQEDDEIYFVSCGGTF